MAFIITLRDTMQLKAFDSGIVLNCMTIIWLVEWDIMLSGLVLGAGMETDGAQDEE